MPMLELLRDSLKRCPVVMKGSYSYFVHPLTDGVPTVAPELLGEVVEEIVRIADTRVDKILTVEAMGIPIGTALSLHTGIPMCIVRKRAYGLEGEVCIEQHTGYSHSKLYINGVAAGDKLLVVDDVISTGGTMTSVLSALEHLGAEVRDVVVVFKRGDGLRRVEQDTKRRIKYLLEVEVVDNRVVEVL
ncbi:MAG: hypoxanthine/guanine phosphoribosyltransferase [Methermicoccaceae archaeon]